MQLCSGLFRTELLPFSSPWMSCTCYKSSPGEAAVAAFAQPHPKQQRSCLAAPQLVPWVLQQLLSVPGTSKPSHLRAPASNSFTLLLFRNPDPNSPRRQGCAAAVPYLCRTGGCPGSCSSMQMLGSQLPPAHKDSKQGRRSLHHKAHALNC